MINKFLINEKGQALVEMALFYPFINAGFGITEFEGSGRRTYPSNSAREGARYAAVGNGYGNHN